jgi:hypothetical protein
MTRSTLILPAVGALLLVTGACSNSTLSSTTPSPSTQATANATQVVARPTGSAVHATASAETPRVPPPAAIATPAVASTSVPPPTSAGPSTRTAARNCGTVSTRGPNPPTDLAAGAVEQCFFAAHAACEGATMTLQSMGVDVSSTTVFTTGAGDCGVSGTTETHLVPNSTRSVTFSCAGLVQQDGGLLFQSCGQVGDITVLAPAP